MSTTQLGRDVPTALRDSPAFDLEDLLDTGVVGLQWLAPDGTVLWANRSEYERLGYALDEYVGHPVGAFHVDEPARNALLSSLARGDAATLEATLRARDGSSRRLLLRTSPRFDEQGRLQHTRCVSQDVTEQRRVEAELRASRQALDLLRSGPNKVADSHAERTALDAIAADVADMLGDLCAVRVLSDDGRTLELCGFSHRDPAAVALIRSLPSTPVGSDRLSARVLASGRPLRLPTLDRGGPEFAALDAETRTFVERFPIGSVMLVPLEAQGKACGTIVVARTRSVPYSEADERLLSELADRLALALVAAAQNREIKLADHERETRERLTVLARASEELSRSLDYERTLESVTEIVLPLLGDFAFFDLREGDEVRRIARAHQDPSLQQLLGELPRLGDETATGGESCCGSTLRSEIDEGWLRGIARDEQHLGALRQLDIQSMITVPLTYQASSLGCLTLFYGSSGRKHTQADLTLAEEIASRAAAAVVNARLFKEAREAIGVRDDFLSMAGHELRTPLTALQLQILSITKVLDQPDGIAKVLNRAEKASRNVLRLSSLVNELLDISRISAGRLKLERAPVDLADAVRDVIARHADELSKNGCEIRFEAAPNAQGIWDPMRVEQIATNLLTNAVKYGKGKPIELKVERGEGVARLIVRDHGIGIPVEDQQRIFQRFERAVSSRHFGGLGFGLWIARQLVDAHGGSIRVTSETGAGATFEVELPLQLSEEVQA